MQATVRTFSLAERRGSVLLDDGTELQFESDVFAASGLRLLRFGQRVRIRLEPPDPDAAPGITALALATQPLPP
jgi:hypothetical protein